MTPAQAIIATAAAVLFLAGIAMITTGIIRMARAHSLMTELRGPQYRRRVRR